MGDGAHAGFGCMQVLQVDPDLEAAEVERTNGKSSAAGLLSALEF
jgi:hypothetical protein